MGRLKRSARMRVTSVEAKLCLKIKIKVWRSAKVALFYLC